MGDPYYRIAYRKHSILHCSRTFTIAGSIVKVAERYVRLYKLDKPGIHKLGKKFHNEYPRCGDIVHVIAQLIAGTKDVCYRTTSAISQRTNHWAFEEDELIAAVVIDGKAHVTDDREKYKTLRKLAQQTY